jgi:hypothetical protein
MRPQGADNSPVDSAAHHASLVRLTTWEIELQRVLIEIAASAVDRKNCASATETAIEEAESAD